MKKYTTPELNVRAFDMEAVLTDSLNGYVAALDGIADAQRRTVDFNGKTEVSVTF